MDDARQRALGRLRPTETAEPDNRAGEANTNMAPKSVRMSWDSLGVQLPSRGRESVARIFVGRG